MADINIVDARGLSCPQPVILARQAMQGSGPGPIAVLVDTGTSRDNVARMARREGWQVQVEETPEGEFRLVLHK
ncbi:MAG: sulfurtransferase TusA family protein [Anaerolineae bacterium]|jgi:TusA-related sulfurtransferase